MASGTWYIHEGKIVFETGVKKVTPSAKQEVLEQIENALKNGKVIRPVERLSYEQLKLIQVLCYEYGELMGYESQHLLSILKALFAYK